MFPGMENHYGWVTYQNFGRIVIPDIYDLGGLKIRAARGNFLTNPKKKKRQKHTTVRIRWWSPTQLLTHRRVA